jgi:hypothetical protein
MLGEHRDAAPAGRLMLRVFRTGALFAAMPWLLGIVDPPEAWSLRAPVALAALAAVAGYGWWTRRRLLRRPGPLNAALGALLTPLSFGVLAELLVIVAVAALPPAGLPLPDLIAVPGFVAIAFGLMAWIGGLGYAAVAGTARLLRRGRATAAPEAREL